MSKQARVLIISVRGVTFENRQALIARLQGGEPVRVVPEPDNAYDPNALRVEVAAFGEIWHVGYIPRERAALIAQLLDGENTIGKVLERTGGFVKRCGSIASYGLLIEFELPPEGENNEH